jgi:hypothetical protein
MKSRQPTPAAAGGARRRFPLERSRLCPPHRRVSLAQEGHRHPARRRTAHHPARADDSGIHAPTRGLHHRRCRQMASRPGRQGRPRLERRDQARPPRSGFRLLIPHACHRRPRAVRLWENQRVAGLDPRDPIQVSYSPPTTRMCPVCPIHALSARAAAASAAT